jgi:hypothetical protein
MRGIGGFGTARAGKPLQGFEVQPDSRKKIAQIVR